MKSSATSCPGIITFSSQAFSNQSPAPSRPPSPATYSRSMRCISVCVSGYHAAGPYIMPSEVTVCHRLYWERLLMNRAERGRDAGPPPTTTPALSTLPGKVFFTFRRFQEKAHSGRVQSRQREGRVIAGVRRDLSPARLEKKDSFKRSGVHPRVNLKEIDVDGCHWLRDVQVWKHVAQL